MKPCPDTFPFPLVALDETASTNQYLSQLCNQLQESVAELTTVTAEFQTAGKGQRGNTWEAEEGKNLLFSFVLYPSFLEARRQFILSQIVSLAIKEELSRWSDEITIKWPNDIYWKDRKICGMLIENTLVGRCIENCIIGVGININQQTFCSDAPNPVSLRQITEKEQEPIFILADTVKRFKDYYRKIQQGQTEDIVRNYRERLYRHNGFILPRRGRCFEAEIHDVEPTGHLVLADRTARHEDMLQGSKLPDTVGHKPVRPIRTLTHQILYYG